MRNRFVLAMVAILLVVGASVAADTITTKDSNVNATVMYAASTSGTSGSVCYTGQIPQNVTAIIEWGAGTTAGQVTIEEAFDCSYAGTWSQLDQVNWSAASSVQAVHIPGAFRAVRLRISTAISGGTINAHVVSR